MKPLEPKRRDYLLALMLWAVSAALLGWAQQDQGVARDEGTYFRAAEAYWGWFDELALNFNGGHPEHSLSAGSIARHWRSNNEHPALIKALFALSWRAFHERKRQQRPFKTLALLSEIAAFRLPAWILTGLGVALLYLFGLRIAGRVAGISAALLYLSMPRVFFHGQLACFDTAITSMWLLVTYGYFRSLSSTTWGILTGVFFGLALATKHNAWFLPAILLVHYLLVVWPDISLRPFHPPRVALCFVAMAILGPLIFVGHWPWLWFDTWDHIVGYFRFHLHHSYYNMEYLGQNWGKPPLPISYPFGMLLFTLPTVTLVLCLVGIGSYARAPVLLKMSQWLGRPPPRLDDPFRFPARRSWRRPGEGLNPRLGTLLSLNALIPLVIIALPQTPIFGGTKHFMPAFPFIALLAGVSVQALCARLSAASSKLARAVALALPAAVALPGAANTVLTHPFGLSQYNALAGGPAGGADLGLNRQFWGYAPRQLLPWINDRLPDNARVYWHDVSPDAHRAYIHDGLLRQDIRYTGLERPAIDGSDYAMVVHELHFNKYDYWIWDSYGRADPVQVLALDGVPLVSLYARRPATTAIEHAPQTQSSGVQAQPDKRAGGRK